MAEAKSSTIEISTKPATRLAERGPKRSSFKYYIHDSVTSCRLQLLGELNEQDLTELDGCWRTIKTTVRTRQLILDLRSLEKADAESNRWLTEMAVEGATYLPDSYFSDASKSKEDRAKAKLNPLARALELLRGACATAVE